MPRSPSTIPPSKLKKLHARQALFAVEYVKDWNGKQAAIRAGYSPKSAAVQAAQLLTKPNIREAVQEAHARTLRGLEISVTRSLREVALMAYLDPADLVDDEGKLLPLKKMPPHARRALTGLKYDGDALREVRITGKLEANEKILRHLAAFPTPPAAVVQVQGKVTVEQLRAIWALGDDLEEEEAVEAKALPAPAPEKRDGGVTFEDIRAGKV